MDLRRLGALGAIVILAAASSAAADEAGAPAPVKTPAHVAKAKPKPKAATPDGGFAAIKFSDPAAPLVGPARPAVAPNAARAPQEPQGDPALALKWHADNEHIDNPYLPPWAPNGQGSMCRPG